MNFYDVLAAENWSGGVPTINFFDLLFAQSMGGGEQWQTYEGTLPATINANGDDMRQYQIWGNTGGVGDRTINLLNFEDVVENMNLSTTTGLPTVYPGRVATKSPIDVSSYDAVTISFEGTQSIKSLRAILSTFTANDELTSRVANIESGRVVDTSNVAYMYVCIYQAILQNIYKSDILNAMLTPHTTPPETYVPYGYEVDMSVSDGTTSTTTPIYIGSDPLDKDEYVDYATQKVYHMMDGTLTPTDPPVALPALPTCDGETVVSYAGESVAPEKVYFEYKGGKQP